MGSVWRHRRPFGPYYALLRTASSAVTSIAPDSAASPELLFRWPSVAVTVLGAWALTLCWQGPPELAISTAALLLATGSFSRYAQEARPYAFVLAAAVACTILWTRLIRDESRRWVVLHALAVASLVAAHLLAASLVFAHLVAAAITSTKENRRSVVLRTSVAAALGLLLVSPISLRLLSMVERGRPNAAWCSPASRGGKFRRSRGRGAEKLIKMATGQRDRRLRRGLPPPQP